MNADELALARGMADTKAALRAWSRAPQLILKPWALGSFVTAVALLVATWIVAMLSRPDPTSLEMPGLYSPSELSDYGFVLWRNGLVLALHALACVAGFMAGSSLPVVAAGHTGLKRKLHDVAGPLAIAFVVGATGFSLGTQAYVIGGDAATLAAQLDLSPAQLLLGVSLHAVPELFALFLPLAAWTMASRRKAWDELLAATVVTVAVAIPILLAAAAIEVWVTPGLLITLSE